MSSAFQPESHRWSKKDLSHVVTQFGCIFKFPLALVPFKLYVEMTANNVWVQKSWLDRTSKAGRTQRSKVGFYSLTKFSPRSGIGHSEGSVWWLVLGRNWLGWKPVL